MKEYHLLPQLDERHQPIGSGCSGNPWEDKCRKSHTETYSQAVETQGPGDHPEISQRVATHHIQGVSIQVMRNQQEEHSGVTFKKW